MVVELCYLLVPYLFFQAPPAQLAKQVLAEVPKQVTDYYKMMGIAPNPRPTGT